METFSALLAICAGNSPVPGEFPTQRPVTQSFDVFFDLRLNKRLSKQWWGWWFQTPSHPLWRHCNVYMYTCWMVKVWRWQRRGYYGGGGDNNDSDNDDEVRDNNNATPTLIVVIHNQKRFNQFRGCPYPHQNSSPPNGPPLHHHYLYNWECHESCLQMVNRFY